MAERRMFAKTIIDSDAFLEMPATSQLLYFHLCMRADDEGFINKPKSIMRQTGCKDDDLKVLISKSFVIPFESGVVVIKHWKLHNYIRGDRLHETKYIDERTQLLTKENQSYSLCQSNVSQLSGSCPAEVRLGKVSIGEVSKEIMLDEPADPPPELDSPDEDRAEIEKQKRNVFSPPSVGQVLDYCQERKNKVDPQKFHNYYSSQGWMVGTHKMKDWKAAVRTWEQNDKKSERSSDGGNQQNPSANANGRWNLPE